MAYARQAAIKTIHRFLHIVRHKTGQPINRPRQNGLQVFPLRRRNGVNT